MSDDEVFYPTLAFGFSGDRLHQLWIGQFGALDWRPVPMLELPAEKRQQSVAGYVPEEDEGE